MFFKKFKELNRCKKYEDKLDQVAEQVQKYRDKQR